MIGKLSMILLLTTVLVYCTQASEYFVEKTAVNGNGSAASPFNSITAALDIAQPGDVIRVLPGDYNEAIRPNRSGIAGLPITIRADNLNDRPRITQSGTVLTIDQDYITIDGLIIDGNFGNSDLVKITNADHTILSNCEIRNGTKDGVDLANSNDVLIENCQIHHLLGGSFSSQVDAHGIVAASEQNLTIRGCEIFYASGDCFQTDPSRGVPRWNNILIENSKLWTGPLPENAAGWKAGEIPGENAVDTKVNSDDNAYRAQITIRNVEAFGFVPGYINNRAAFNIKEKVECRLESVKAHHNEIAFRLRGPGSNGGAYVTMINTIAYANDKIFRTEDGLEKLHIYNSTFDNGTNGQYFQNASGGYDNAGFDLRNCLFLGTKPGDASDPSNMSANSGFFIDAAANDYRLSSTSPAIDAGVDIAEVSFDFSGTPRQQGSYDVGAFEFNSTTGIDDAAPDDGTVKGFFLHPNYPNPFNPETTIAFETARLSQVQLEIFDTLGRHVRTLVRDFLPAGAHNAEWNGQNDFGQQVGSGVYLYRLIVGQSAQTRRMQLIR